MTQNFLREDFSWSCATSEHTVAIKKLQHEVDALKHEVAQLRQIIMSEWAEKTSNRLLKTTPLPVAAS